MIVPEGGGAELGQFRSYLRMLAERHLDPQLKHRLDPSDIVQETLLEAYAQGDSFRGKTAAELAAYLRSILQRNLSNAVRDNTRQKRDLRREQRLREELDRSSARLEEWAVADQSTPSSHVARDEQAAQVADALMQLPEEQRTVLVMKNWDGLTLDQIAQRTGKTPGSVAGLYQRGLKKLRALLDARVDDL